MFGLLRRRRDDVKVIGKATKFKSCRMCGVRDCQSPRGRGEVITRGGFYIVRQYFVCETCNTKSLWHRRLDKFEWTMERSGW